MERKILFRGKRVDNGEWVEGYYAALGDVYHYILSGKLTIIENCPTFGHTLVDVNTIGRYTGLTDKNGKKIFEGDIVRHYNNPSRPEEFDVGVINYDEDHCVWCRTSSKSDDLPYIWKSCVYEVIGNIHDNPELLGGLN